MRGRQLLITTVIASLAISTASCATGPEADLARVQGMNSQLASCLLDVVDGRIETERVVAIVDAQITGTSSENDLITRAFINCV